MLNHPTYQQLNQLRLFGMAKALNSTAKQAIQTIAKR